MRSAAHTFAAPDARAMAMVKAVDALSLVGAVVGEFYGADRGLGFLVITAATQLRTDLLFVAIFVLAAIGVLTFSLFGWLERCSTRGAVAVERN